MKKILFFLLFPISLFAQDGILKTLVAGGVADAYTITESLPSTYDQKERFQVIFPFNNTGTATLKRATLAIRTIKKNDGSNLSANDIVAGAVYMIAYNSNGAYYQCETCGGTSGGGGTWGSITGTLSNQTDLQSALNAKLSSAYYQTIQNSGSGLTQRPTFNFTNGLTATDNSGASRTDIVFGGTTISNTFLDDNSAGNHNFRIGSANGYANIRLRSSNFGLTNFGILDLGTTQSYINFLSSSTVGGTLLADVNGSLIQSNASGGLFPTQLRMGLDASGSTYFKDNRTGVNQTGLEEFADYSANRRALGYITMGHSDARYLGISSSAASVANALSISSELISGGASSYNGGVAKSIGIQPSSVTNGMLAGSIAYSKLSLTGAILNADLAGSIDLTTKVTGLLPDGNISSASNWNTAYNRSGTSLTFSSSTFTFTKQDASTLTASVPTFNQNTTGSAAKWTTARNIAGNSVDGSANVNFSNAFIVQGTTDAGLTGAQFLGALGTGLVKNTTTTGVLSIAVANTDYQSPITFGTGVLTALGVNIGSAGAPVLFGGAGGTPTSLTLTNATGLPLTTGVTGILPIANGGSNKSSFTSGSLLYFDGTRFQEDNASLFYDATNKISYVGGNSGGSSFAGLRGYWLGTNTVTIQTNVQNLSNGTGASSDISATADTGTDAINFINMGINSSGNTSSGVLGGVLTSYIQSNGGTFATGTNDNNTFNLFTNLTTRLSITGDGTWTTTLTNTATANNYKARNYSSTLTSRATASDAIFDSYLNSTFNVMSTSIDAVGGTIDYSTVLTGGLQTSGVVQTSGSPAGMTATTYTLVSAASTSGSGTGAVFTVVVSNATTISSVTVTTAGSGYKNGDTFTFNGSQFGGSGSRVFSVYAVTGVSLGTNATALRIINRIPDISGANVNKKYIDFVNASGTSIGGIRYNYSSTRNTIFFDDASGNFMWSDGTNIQLVRPLQLSSTLSTGIITQTAGGTAVNNFANSINSSYATATTLTDFTAAAFYHSGTKNNNVISNNVNFFSFSGNPTIQTGVIQTLGSITGGSGYVNGTYTLVPLTGGSGTLAQATITVSGGAVTVVTITTRGLNYRTIDVLSASNTNLGGSGSGFSIPVSVVDYSGVQVAGYVYAPSQTSTSSAYLFGGFMGKPTYNLSADFTGKTFGFWWEPTMTANTGSRFGVIVASGLDLSGLGTTNPGATLQINGAGSNPTFKTVGAGTGTNYSRIAYQSDGTTIINFLKDNGDFQVGLSSSKLGFYGTTAIVKPSGNLATAISNLGLVTSPTIAVTDVTNLLDGTYTPSLTNVTNVTGSTAYVTGYYRIGNSVTVYGKIAINSTLAASTATEVAISLPIASNLASEEDLGGTAVSDAIASETARIKADATNDRASVTFKSISISNDSYSFEFSYQIK